ncbi:hypothetical protein BSLG_001431 [Batrachochytrium salamandrivorans]|nr:hypothetical protein BSLG_001431 [Batrachochytrium salamandrivorans]
MQEPDSDELRTSELQQEKHSSVPPLQAFPLVGMKSETERISPRSSIGILRHGTSNSDRPSSGKFPVYRTRDKSGSIGCSELGDKSINELQARLLTVASRNVGPHFELCTKRKSADLVAHSIPISEVSASAQGTRLVSPRGPPRLQPLGTSSTVLSGPQPHIPDSIFTSYRYSEKEKAPLRPIILGANRSVINPARPLSPRHPHKAASTLVHKVTSQEEDIDSDEFKDALIGFQSRIVPPIEVPPNLNSSQKRIRTEVETSDDMHLSTPNIGAMDGAKTISTHWGNPPAMTMASPDIDEEYADMDMDKNDLEGHTPAPVVDTVPGTVLAKGPSEPMHVSKDDPQSPFVFLKFLTEHPHTKEFIYMTPIKTLLKPSHSAFNPYNLQISEFSEINTRSFEGFYTMSSKGVTHFNNLGHGDFTPLQQWTREYHLFHSLLKIPFFSRYRQWKCFTLWKKTVLHTKIQHTKKQLTKNLFIMHPVLRTAILQIQALNAEISLHKRLFSVEHDDNYELREFVRKQKMWIDQVSIVTLRTWGEQIREIVERASLVCLMEKGFDVQASLMENSALKGVTGDVGKLSHERLQSSRNINVSSKSSTNIPMEGFKPLTFTEQAARRSECRRLQRFVKLVDYTVISTLQLLAIQSVQDLLKSTFRGCLDSDVIIDRTGTGTVLVGEAGYTQNTDFNTGIDDKFSTIETGASYATEVSNDAIGVQVGGLVVGAEVTTTRLCECGFEGFSDILSRIVMATAAPPQANLAKKAVAEQNQMIDDDDLTKNRVEPSTQVKVHSSISDSGDKWKGTTETSDPTHPFVALFRTELLIHHDTSKRFYFSPSLQDYLGAVDTILQVYLTTIERVPPITNSIAFLDPANLAGCAYSSMRGLEDVEFGEGPQIGSIVIDGGYFRELCGRIRGVFLGMFSNASKWVGTLETVRTMWIENEGFHGLEDLRQSAGEMSYLLATTAEGTEGSIAGVLLQAKRDQELRVCEQVVPTGTSLPTEINSNDQSQPINILELVSNVSLREDGSKYSPLVDFFDKSLSRFAQQKRTMTDISVRSTINNILIDTNQLKTMLVPSPERCFNEVAHILPGIARNKNELLLTEVQTWVRVLNTQPTHVEGFVEYLGWLEKVRENMPVVNQLEDEVAHLYALLDLYEIKIQPTDLAMFQTLGPSLRSLKDAVEVAIDTREESITRFTIDLEKSMAELLNEVSDIRNRTQDPMVLSSFTTSEVVIKFLEDLRHQLEKVEVLKKRYEQWSELFKRDGAVADIHSGGLPKSTVATENSLDTRVAAQKGSELDETKNEIDLKMTLWISLKEWSLLTESWKTQAFDLLVTEDINTKITGFVKIIYNLDKGLPPNEVVPRLKSLVEEYRAIYPTIVDLRNPSLKQRHWEKIQDAIGKSLVKDEGFTLAKLMDLRVFDFKEEISSISSQADSEAALEEMLARVFKNWSEAEFIVTPYRDNKDVFILGSVEDIQTLLEDSQVIISTIKRSRFIGPIRAEVERWDKQLILFSETLDSWLTCQRNWLYLESIFSSPDIQRQLPDEARMFSQVDRSWKDIMRRVSRNPNAMKSGTLPGLLETLQQNNSLEFSSNDPKSIDIVAMISPEGERVPFLKTIKARGNVEGWLGNIEEAMVAVLRRLIKSSIAEFEDAKRSNWVREHVGQVVITGNQILWCRDVTEALKSSDPGKALLSLKHKCINNLLGVAMLVRSELTKIQRAILGGLITIDVHNRDIVQGLVLGKITGPGDFEWTKQQRYYWDVDSDTCHVKMSTSVFSYGYEYLGCSPRLVITPLTDRCYLTLTGALQLNLGGSPVGPAGVTVSDRDFGDLVTAVKDVMRDRGLDIVDGFVSRVCQLSETMRIRHGVMLVGPTGGGKTTCYEVLQEASGRLHDSYKSNDYQHVKTWVINPKCVDMAELYGEFNLATMEWKDGLIGCIFRAQVSDTSPRLYFVRHSCKEYIKSVDLNLVSSLCKLIHTYINRTKEIDFNSPEPESKTLFLNIFLFCYIWSIGGNLADGYQDHFDTFMREMLDASPIAEAQIPTSSNVFSYLVDLKTCRFILWDDIVPSFKFSSETPYFDMIVPTSITVKYAYLLEALISNSCPVLFTGNTGVGKSIIIQDLLNRVGRKNKNLNMTLNFSAQTNSAQTQQMVELKLEKKRKNIFGAPIFKSIVEGFLKPFSAEIKSSCEAIVNSAIEIYHRMCTELLPTPAKSHYTFNMRDLSKVVQGMLQARPGSITTKTELVRLFCHESSRVFHDRLIDDVDRQYFNSLLSELSEKNFGIPMSKENFATTPIMFGDFSKRGVASVDRIYCEMVDMKIMTVLLEEYLEEYNVTMNKDLRDALLSVSRRFLEFVDLGSDEMKDKVAGMCVEIHASVGEIAKKFYTELRRRYYTTPTSYLELINLYVSMLQEKRKELGTSRDRLRNGLNKLAETNDLVSNMQVELESLGPELKVRAQDTEALMIKIAKDQETADGVRKIVFEEEAVVRERALQTEVIATEAQRDLDEALPALDAAYKALDGLEKKDIAELKVFSKPPDLVLMVMEAICILFKFKPDWENSKKLLSDPQLMRKMAEYDKDNIPESISKKLKKYIESPNFNPDAVEKVSRACKSICMWAIAMDLYSRVFKEVLPKRKRLEEAQSTLEITKAKLAEKAAALAEVESQLEKLKAKYENSVSSKRLLIDKMEETTRRLSRASKLTLALADEQIRWTDSVERLHLQIDNLVGNIFLSAASVAYFGAFTSSYRTELVQQWVVSCQSAGIPVSANFHLLEHLADPAVVRDWNIQGLPADALSIENGQLLADVVRLEKPDLEEQRNSLIVNIARDKRQLKDIEEKILKMLFNSQGNILDDEELINTLNQSKITSAAINERVLQAEQTEQDINMAREKYRPVAIRGSVLYFVISDLTGIDPMYQFSLKYFANLFNNCIIESEKFDDLNKRIQKLCTNTTYETFSNVSRGLFSTHKMLFAFMICVEIMREGGKINDTEWKADMPFLMHIPGDMTSQLTDIHKLLLIKVFREEKLVLSAIEFIKRNMGEEFVDIPPLDLAKAFKDTTPSSPLIFILSTGSDPVSSLVKFANSSKVAKQDNLHMISLGQGQGPIAEELVKRAMASGDWVFLQNCHLAASWMGRLETLVKECGQPETEINPEFRLFLSSMPSKIFPISVLQEGVKVTNEPPKGLRANLARSFSDISRDIFDDHPPHGVKFRKLLFGVCFFNAIIHERKKFGALGWNITYDWSNSDLEVSITILRNMLQEYKSIPWDALLYLTGEITFGGRVTDDWDRRSLKSILGRFYTPHILDDSYRFSPPGVYYAPADGDLSHFKNYIDGLPFTEESSVFGMHENANISYQMQETRSLIGSILEVQPRLSNVGNGKSAEELVIDIATAILDGWPNTLNFEIPNSRPTSAKPSVVEDTSNSSISEELFRRDKSGRMINSLSTVLLQEAARFNKLNSLIRNSLEGLIKAVKGLIVMSPDFELVFQSLLNNKVPVSWANHAYPSLKQLASWVKDFHCRMDMIKKWAKQGPPKQFWLPGFFFPQGFLTGVMQNHARKYSIPIDTLVFDFKVMDYDESDSHYAPVQSFAVNDGEDGVLVSGLFLEGARWDKEKRLIQDSYPMEMYSIMPPIRLLPTQTAPQKDKSYVCPLYKTSARAGTLSTTGHSTNFVVAIFLPSDKPSDYWVAKGVALLSLPETIIGGGDLCLANEALLGSAQDGVIDFSIGVASNI